MSALISLAYNVDDIWREVLEQHRRVLLWGETGAGKSSLAHRLAQPAGDREPLGCLNCDPGNPAFGPPGVVGAGRWHDGAWTLDALEPLCTLDAARFRLPLVDAARSLIGRFGEARVVIDTPGIVRGMAASELLTALVHATEATAVIMLHGHTVPLADELATSTAAVFSVPVPSAVRRDDAATRAKMRTRLWDAYLAGGDEIELQLHGLRLLGAPPPATDGNVWIGRQVAVGRKGQWIGLGEVRSLELGRLSLLMVGDTVGADRLLVRDAARDANHQLRSVRRVVPPPRGAVKQSSRGNAEFRSGTLVANLINGVTGDPLLMVRQRHRRGALLFDLGDAHAVSRRVLHTVTDVFVSHAHLDHLAGFPYLLRSRLSAELPALRIYGPPGLCDHIAGFLAGTRWDRIGEDGPGFEVSEFDGKQVQQFHLQAGARLRRGRSFDVDDGILLQTSELCVRAKELDHGIPVLAFALQMLEQHNVDPQRLKRRGLAPGPWLGDLKACVRRGEADALISLPDGSVASARELSAQLLFTSRGPKIVYATDLADHRSNRDGLSAFAAGAAILFCESTFRNADAEFARRTQHLTAGACGEIARAAKVHRLVPFHLSKRYEGKLAEVYAEIESACGDITVERHPAIRTRS